ncbi:MAG: hypothetical protein NVV63_09330 [Opitutus sp.]|nr:hypothetical protein [Opitutus sp.]
MKKILFYLGLAGALAVMAGCSSPQSRIQKNPEAFNRLTPAQQEAIKAGRIDIGFDGEMVKLALGDPDRVRERIDANGRSEVWDYVTYEGTDGMILYRGWYHRGWRHPMFPYYLDYGSRREREKVRVTFKDGKVVSIEQDKTS